MQTLTENEVSLVSGGLYEDGDGNASGVWDTAAIYGIQYSGGPITPTIPTVSGSKFGWVVTGIRAAGDLLTVKYFAEQMGAGEAWDQFRSNFTSETIFSSGGRVYYNGTNVTMAF